MLESLYARPLLPHDHPALVEILRRLYNDALNALNTKDLHYNTEMDQWLWWLRLDHHTTKIHLYSPINEPWNIIAFSMVTDHGSYCSPMFAIASGYHGRGYGEQIIQHYLFLAGQKPLHGSQRMDNQPIRHLNKRNGWIVVKTEGDIEHVYHPNPGQTQEEINREILRYHGIEE